MKIVIFSLSFIAACGSGANAQDAGSREMWRSSSLNKFFIGYFVPVASGNDYNFTTCAGDFLTVSMDDLEKIPDQKECVKRKNPLTLLTAQQYIDQAVGQEVYSLSGVVVGQVASIAVSEKGEPSAYIVSALYGNENAFFVADADSVSAWSTGSGLRFLTSAPLVSSVPQHLVPDLKMTVGAWGNPDTAKYIAGIVKEPGPIFDLRQVLENGTDALNDRYSAFSPEEWLPLQ